MRNDTSKPVSVSYAGSLLERGTIRLQPGETRHVVVYRGECEQFDWIRFSLRVRRNGTAQKYSYTLADVLGGPQRREWFDSIIVIDDDGVRIEQRSGEEERDGIVFNGAGA